MTRKKADVKGLQEYIARTYHRGTVFLTGGLVGFNGWYPEFDMGKAGHYPLESLPRIDDRILVSRGEPVFLFFYFHNYFLTPSSKYPIVPIPVRETHQAVLPAAGAVMDTVGGVVSNPEGGGISPVITWLTVLT